MCILFISSKFLFHSICTVMQTMSYVLPPRVVVPPSKPKLVLPPATKKRTHSEIDDDNNSEISANLIAEAIKQQVLDELFQLMVREIEPQIRSLVNQGIREWDENMTTWFDSKVAKLYGDRSKCVGSDRQLSKKILADVLQSLCKVLSQQSDV